MVDVLGIEKTPIYKTCFLRRHVIKLMQKEIESADFSLQSKDMSNLHRMLGILNRELKLIGAVK